MPSPKYAVILAGGSGTRFWPASRIALPKQFLALGPNPNETLLAGTVRRLLKTIPVTNLIIATGTHLADSTRKLLPFLPEKNILAEPTPRNTAPCIAWANAVVQRSHPDAVVAVVSADHIAQDETSFHKAFETAINVADSGVITTIGIVPTRPETGYGYIEKGQARSDGAHAALRFIEKPDHDKAVAMVESNQFLWNAGFFFFRAKQMTEAIRHHMPSLADGIDKLDEAAKRNEELKELDRIFAEFPSVSIDVGIMEKLDTLAVVEADFGWSDVGSWQTAWELSTKDNDNNTMPDGSIAIDSRGNIVANWSSTEPANNKHDKVIALVGIENLVIVQTDDATLIMPRSRSQDVRLVVDRLRTQGRLKML